MTELGTVATTIMGVVSDVIDVVVAQPILMIGLAAGLLGTGIALFKKLA